MRNQILSQQRPRERGQTILFVALAMVSLLGMAALAIDVVTLYLARSEIQRAADTAALAAAKAVADSGFTTLASTDPNYPAANILAQRMATAAINPFVSTGTPNLVAGTVPLLVGSPTIDLTHQGDARITVNLKSANLPTFFSKIFGRGAANVTAAAAAEAYNPSNIQSFTPIAPLVLKPWLIANSDPYNGGGPFINTATGAVESAAFGNDLNLTLDCKTSVTTPACQLARNPPTSNSVKNQIDYVPLQVVANPKNICPACAGATDYEQSIECADVTQYVSPSCGGGAANANWDNSVNPGIGGSSGISAVGAECLIHASSTGSAGQDMLIEPALFFSAPVQIKAQSGPQTGNLVTTSNSVVTIPIVQTCVGVNCFSTGGPVTVVGYMQAFVKQVNDGTGNTTAGDIQVSALNISGCSATPNNAVPNPIVGGGGASPVPVRLISPP
jgi:hypothetical protein